MDDWPTALRILKEVLGNVTPPNVLVPQVREDHLSQRYGELS